MRGERRVFPDHNLDGAWCAESNCLADGDERLQKCPTCGQLLETLRWVPTHQQGAVDMKGGGGR